jgi:hypothetical protein
MKGPQLSRAADTSRPAPMRRVRKPTEALTPAEAEALAWAKSNYRRWRKRFSGQPEDLPRGYQPYYWRPFGIALWNQYVHVVRLYLERTAGFKYIRPADDVLASLEGRAPASPPEGGLP